MVDLNVNDVGYHCDIILTHVCFLIFIMEMNGM